MSLRGREDAAPEIEGACVAIDERLAQRQPVLWLAGLLWLCVLSRSSWQQAARAGGVAGALCAQSARSIWANGGLGGMSVGGPSRDRV
jgi:hypothetical protein